MAGDKAAVFILLGQSNAVGRGRMEEQEQIVVPLKNVYGLDRDPNLSFSEQRLVWSHFRSSGMNLGETADHTGSVSDYLAKLYQEQIDRGAGLPDLYTVQIAVGSQGVTRRYMWNPEYGKKLIPGALGTVDIALYPFTLHIFQLLADFFRQENKELEVMGIHWIGGENDACEDRGALLPLKSIYCEIFSGFRRILGEVPIILHRLVCADRMNDLDPSGQYLRNMHEINAVFEQLAAADPGIRIFDPTAAPYYIPGIRGNGIFQSDAVHFTKEMNRWKAEKILSDFMNGLCGGAGRQ
ncbi:MAG: hypothetical protein PUC59_06740 [Firmicutes bacterium]|nr:hypothetical protein [Bacillota bacterium]